jgi:hypothetical protein
MPSKRWHVAIARSEERRKSHNPRQHDGRALAGTAVVFQTPNYPKEIEVNSTPTLSHPGAICTPSEVSDAVTRDRLDPDIDPVAPDLVGFDRSSLYFGGDPTLAEINELLAAGRPFTIELYR